MKARRPTTRGQQRRLRLWGCYKIARFTPGRTRWQALGYAIRVGGKLNRVMSP